MLNSTYWFKRLQESGFKTFSVLMAIIIKQYTIFLTILNEELPTLYQKSFNAKNNNFRLQLRRLIDESFSIL